MNDGKIAAIIPAAGRGQRMLSMTDNCPKSMLPVANKPLIAHHIEKLLSQNINDIYIVVGYKKEVLIEYVSKIYGKRDNVNITFIEQKELLGLAHAIKLAMDKINLDEFTKIFITLGDCIVQDDNIYANIKANNSFVVYKEVEDYSRWCLLQMDNSNNIITFIDKPDEEPEDKNAVVGVYYFNNSKLFYESLKTIIKNDIKIKNEFQLSSAMMEYIHTFEEILKGVKCEKWFDFGEIETYNESKKHFNLARCFNNVDYSNNSIIKKSSNYNKIQREILWFLSLPKQLQSYVPKLVDYSLIDDNVYYELEYVNGSTLQELFVCNYLTCEDWNKILKLIDDAICRFKFTSNTHSSDLFTFLSKSINTRVSMIKQSSNLIVSKLLDSHNPLIINGNNYLNLEKLLSYIMDRLNKLKSNSEKYSQIIHGDLVFSNIIYDIGSNQIKLIDPRGNFNGDIVYGDIRYDIAKLAQCIVGKYDYIVNDLFDINWEADRIDGCDSIHYEIYDFNNKCDITPILYKMIDKYDCSITEILFITAIQFLTMIPLHSENVNHQLLMYVKFVELMNQCYERDKIVEKYEL